MLDRQMHRFGGAAARRFANHHAVDDGVEVVVLPRGDFRHLIQVVDLPVEPRADEAGLANGGQLFLVSALPPTHERREDHCLRALRQGLQPLDDLLG